MTDLLKALIKATDHIPDGPVKNRVLNAIESDGRFVLRDRPKSPTLTDLREVLNDILNGIELSPRVQRNIREAIAVDGRIGVLPTRSELEACQRGEGTLFKEMIAAGYAREDDEPMTTPDLTPEVESYILGRRAFEESRTTDPDSAAVDAIAKVLWESSGITKPDIAWFQEQARAVLDYLREHPEHLDIPVMMEGDMQTLLNKGRISQAVLIIPDPDPPAAVVPKFPRLETLVEDAINYIDGESHTMPDTVYDSLRSRMSYLWEAVEAANGGGAK